MSIGDSLFYYPTRSVYGRPETYGMTYSSEFFESMDGTRLHGWFLSASGGMNAIREAKGTVVHCHGNSGNISGHFELVRWLPEQGWNVFCFDYRGYGRSEGRPTRLGTIEDVQAAVYHVRNMADVDGGKIVILGQSLGGAVGIVAAALCPDVRGLAVEGAFSGYQREADFVTRQNAVLSPISGWLSRMAISEGYDPIDWVNRISPRPMLFVCGTKDTVVDHQQTVDLHDAAGGPKELCVIEDGLHADSMREVDGQRRFSEFFKMCVNGGIGV